MTATGGGADPATPVKCIDQSQQSVWPPGAAKPRAQKPQMTVIIANAAMIAIRRLRRNDRVTCALFAPEATSGTAGRSWW